MRSGRMCASGHDTRQKGIAREAAIEVAVENRGKRASRAYSATAWVVFDAKRERSEKRILKNGAAATTA